MSSTRAVHVRYDSWYISLPLQDKTWNDQILRCLENVTRVDLFSNFYRGQPEAGTGHKMLFFKVSFPGPRFPLWQNREGIPDKDCNFWGNDDNFHNLYERLFHDRKLKSGYLKRRIYERPLHLRVNLLSRIKASIFQNYFYINLL